jgi:uncharacterized membrane protein HdeD (DUF308 family)
MTATPLETAKERTSDVISRLWWLILLRGILLLVLGLYALARPGMTLVVFTQVLAVFVLADGVLALLAGIFGWTESRLWMIVRGALAILVGVFVLGHAAVVGMIAATILVFVFAFQAIVGGVLEIVVAIRERKEIEGEGWLIVGGVLSIIFGLILLASPLMSSLILIRILGAFAIVFGVALIVNSFRVRAGVAQIHS